MASATDVKWTSASNDGDNEDPAATAPKSQKYWDEHNIERPDYAKTDAEMLMERGGGGLLILKILLFLAVSGAVGFFAIWPRIQHGPGHTLGSSTGSAFFFPFSSRRSDDEARQARLSRFATEKTE